MEKNKRLINILLVVIMILVVIGCILGYIFFTKDKTKPIIDPEEKRTIQNQEKIFSIENYPKVECLAETLPLAEAFEANLTGTDVKEINITYSKAEDAYTNLINGDTDLILVTYPSEEEKNLVREKNGELDITPIAKDAFVFFVNTDNPIDNLTSEQIQDIYSGKTRSWKDLGGENEKIIAYQRPENSVSQKGMMSLVMKGKKMATPIIGNIKYDDTEINDVILDYSNEKTTIGYAYNYYARTMYITDKMKLLAIDGIDPTYENIQTGLYGLQTKYYAVTRKNEEQNSDVLKLLDTMKSNRGQNVVKEAGYVQNY